MPEPIGNGVVPDDHDAPDYFDDESDDLEDAANECGQHDGGCDLAGTEYCDWMCPFSAEFFRQAAEQPRGGA